MAARRDRRHWITVSEVRENFAPAVRAAWPYTLLGLAIGFALLSIHHLLSHEPQQPDSLVTTLIEHLGIGFIVSALAVFFYEWGAEAKKAIDLGEKLTEIINAQGEKALGLSLTILLGGDKQPAPAYLSNLISNMESLVNTVSDIQNQGTWAKDEHVHFISDLLDSVVVRNAVSLRDLTKRGEYHFTVPPSGAEMADEILAAQMRAMAGGDSYDVISNLTAWKDGQLAKLHHETEEAIERNVRVRRLFNLMREYRESLSSEEARSLLEAHLKNADDWKPSEGHAGYEVKVLGPTEFERIKDNVYHDKIKEAHFGIFAHGQEHLRVKVERADLSDMVMSKDPKTIEADLDLFKEAWYVAIPLTKELIEQIVEQLAQKGSKGNTPKVDGGA